MPTHWTYDHFETEEDLRQGDILEPSTSLRDVLREVHPHFLDPQYTAFLITTQTCDLVRRGKPRTCSTGYVNIVVVRSIEDVLHDLISHRCKPVASQIYLQEICCIVSLTRTNRLLVYFTYTTTPMQALQYLRLRFCAWG